MRPLKHPARRRCNCEYSPQYFTEFMDASTTQQLTAGDSPAPLNTLRRSRKTAGGDETLPVSETSFRSRGLRHLGDVSGTLRISYLKVGHGGRERHLNPWLLEAKGLNAYKS